MEDGASDRVMEPITTPARCSSPRPANGQKWHALIGHVLNGSKRNTSTAELRKGSLRKVGLRQCHYVKWDYVKWDYVKLRLRDDQAS